MVSASGRVAMLITAIVIAGCGASDESAPPPARAAAQTEKTDDRRFMPVSDALAIVREHVDVPVTVPALLPAGVRARKPVVSGPTAQLTLKVPNERFRLIIWYGRTGFDGCGPIDPREVTVNGRPAVLDTDSYRSKLVWPATLQNLEGRFALYGRFSGKRLLAFAESMTARGAPSGGPKTSC